MDAEVDNAPGFGAPINFSRVPHEPIRIKREGIKIKHNQQSGGEFLKKYSEDIAALPPADNASDYINKLNEKERQIFTTLLPLAAAIKKRNASLKLHEIIEETKRRSVNEIDEVLK